MSSWIQPEAGHWLRTDMSTCGGTWSRSMSADTGRSRSKKGARRNLARPLRFRIGATSFQMWQSIVRAYQRLMSSAVACCKGLAGLFGWGTARKSPPISSQLIKNKPTTTPASAPAMTDRACADTR
jgi:hypothetical protein